MAGEPQTDVQILVIPFEAGLETTPTIAEVGLLACPDNAGYRLELLGVGVSFHTLPVDAGDPATVDIEWVDDSNSDTAADLIAGFDFLSGLTARVNNQIWRGSQILDPGDTVNAELTVDTPTTAGAGAAFIVEFRILARNAG
jgi:hypothetical protein